MAIELDDFLKDIDPDQVCGEDLQYDTAFIDLEQVIKGKPEQQMGSTVIEAEPPNWRDIKKRSEALLSRSIDLRLLVFYLRSLTALEGFSGLNDGLLLLKEAVETRWDTIHPQLDPDDDNDPTERINVLLSLCDYETLVKLLQQVPLIESRALGQFGYRDFSIASGKSTATSNEKAVNQTTIDGAIQDADIEHLKQTFKAIAESLDNLNLLESSVTDYVGIGNAASFSELRLLLKESKAFLASALESRGVNDEVEPDENEAENGSENGTVTVSQKSVLGVINNNQDVIKTLNLVCDYYKKHEPSSPVPMFIDRAIRLVGKNFMDVLQDLAPAGVDEAKFILGKKEEI